MSTVFYPHPEDLQTGSVMDRLDVLLESAQRYKTAVLDSAAKNAEGGFGETKIRSTPREIDHAYNWDEIAKLLRELRDMPESSPIAKTEKSLRLKKLAEIYEVLRAARMPKLEAVRLALMNEVAHLNGSSAA